MQVDQRVSPNMKENCVPRVKYILVAFLPRAREDESLSQATEEGFRYLHFRSLFKHNFQEIFSILPV